MPDTLDPAPVANDDDVLAQIKSMVDLPETATDMELITVLVNIIANLQEKYEGMLADAAALEDNVANRELADFADILPEKSKAFWKEQLLSNRAAALEALASLRESVKQAPPPAPEQAPPTVPLRNRLAAITRTVEDVSKQTPPPKADNVAARIRNRAHQITTSENIPFIVAFARAEKEITKE